MAPRSLQFSTPSTRRARAPSAGPRSRGFARSTPTRNAPKRLTRLLANCEPMKVPRLKIVVFGLSITSSWGNGHATTYRGLIRALVARGHEVLFLERDVPWYAAARDLPKPPYGRTVLYKNLSGM